MTNLINLCFEVSDPHLIELAELYWSMSEDGSWAYTAKELAETFSISNSQLTTQVAAASTAFIINCRCPECALPHSAKSRSELTIQTRARNDLCLACLEAERKKEEELLIQKRRRDQDLKSTIWLRETSLDRSFDYQMMSYKSAIFALLLIVNSEMDELTGEILPPEPRRFSPDPTMRRKALVQLHNEGVLFFGKRTPLDAFVVSEEDSKAFSYYPERVSWRFALPDSGKSFGQIYSEISDVIDDKDWADDYTSSVADLWWRIAVAESKRHLDSQLDNYYLSVDDSEKLTEAIKYCLQNFSIPQVRNLMWRVAKDIAAYAARRDVHQRQAINAIPGNLIRICDRAISGRWEIQPYVLKWDEEESLITTMLFDRVLRTGIAGFKNLTGKLLVSTVMLSKNEPATSDQ